MRVAMLTPLPPARTGVAHYVSLILPTLGEQVDLHSFSSLDGYRPEEYDVAVYQLGNNPFHEFAYREALEQPGVAVLHDIVLHHLIVEMTLARGDAAGYIAALRRNHGEAGAAWAEGRAAGLHSEMGNFLLPASVEVANRSRAVIVHNRYAAETLRSLGVATPIHVAPHPFIGARKTPSRAAVRSRLEIPSDAKVIGFFGFLTSAKRAEVVLEAFSRARGEDEKLHLLVVGEAAPNIDRSLFEQDAITVTGYVEDEDFEEYYAAADRIVNLRYPTAGETSGTLIRAFAAGLPVAVSDYAQFAEFPDECVVKVPLGGPEVDALAAFFRSQPNEVAIATAQWRWLEENASPESTVSVYLEAIRLAAEAAPDLDGVSAQSGVSASIPLFPMLEVTDYSGDRITIRNRGDGVLHARSYGTPGYRLIAKLFAGGGEVADRWIELPRDVAPGEEFSLTVPYVEGTTLRLYHAMEGIPMLEPEPWYASRV